MRVQQYNDLLLNDQALISAYRSGDKSALKKLYKIHYEATLGWASKYTKTRQDREDLAQEAFARVISALAKGKGPKYSFGLYLASAVRNIAYNNKNIEFSVSSEELNDLLEGEGFQEESGRGESIVASFYKISESQQQAVWLKDILGHKSNEAAKILGISNAAFSQLYKRAREELADQYLLDLELNDKETICQEYKYLLAKYARNRLNKTQTEIIDKHIAGCSECAQMIYNMRKRNKHFMVVLPIAPGVISLPWVLEEEVLYASKVPVINFDFILDFAANLVSVKINALINIVALTAFSLANLYAFDASSLFKKTNFSATSQHSDIKQNIKKDNNDNDVLKTSEDVVNLPNKTVLVDPESNYGCGIIFQNDQDNQIAKNNPGFLIDNHSDENCNIKILWNNEILSDFSMKSYDKDFISAVRKGEYTIELSVKGENSSTRFSF